GAIVHHFAETIADYAETAALVKALDMVVSVCTAVAHLAGGLGVPLRVLAPTVPSWRYLGAGDLPWYPQAKVYRRRPNEVWGTMAQRVLTDLCHEIDLTYRPSGGKIASIAATKGDATSQVSLVTACVGATLTSRSNSALSSKAAGGEARITDLEASLDEAPESGRQHYDLALAYFGAGRTVDALDHLQLAVHFDPTLVDAWLRLAETEAAAGRNESALQDALSATRHAPDDGRGWVAVARAYYALARYQDGLAAAEQGVARLPNDPNAYQALGLNAHACEAYPRAHEAYQRCFELAPVSTSVQSNLAMACLNMARFEEARRLWEGVVAREPNHFVAQWNLAQIVLAAREFERGWDHYEYRERALEGKHPTAYLPRWSGAEMKGRRLLVLGEQGIGDQIMFASCLPDLIRAGIPTTLLCEARLVGLFARSFPTINVRGLEAVVRDPIQADIEIPMGSLPGLYRRSAGHFPRHNGYLRADPARVAYWRERFDATAAGKRIVGISWRGGTAGTRASLRSIPLRQWAPILTLPNTQFVSLQYGDVGAEIRDAQAALGVAIQEITEIIPSYEETAAVVAALDEVVTVCTSLVHLAGAMAKRTTVMVPAVPEWRYGLVGDEMPWYPTVALVRQPKQAPWSVVVESVASNLRSA
ncbi:MAG: tetratricopeptide repeat protein, partial [Burkholderiales bacterium]